MRVLKMYARVWGIWKPWRIVVLAALSPLAVYALFFPFCTTHTHTHTHTQLFAASSLSILPSPSYFPPWSCQKKWLSFKWPTQHGKITRLSSRSALCADITLAHEKHRHTAEDLCKAMHLHAPCTHSHYEPCIHVFLLTDRCVYTHTHLLALKLLPHPHF